MKLPKKNFYVSEKKKTVVAKYETPFFVDEAIIDETKCSKSLSHLLSNLPLHLPENSLVLSDFEARSVCMDEDEFSPKAGEDIAGIKCDRKYHAAVVKRCQSYINLLFKLATSIADVMYRHIDKISNIDEDLKRYYGVEIANEGN